jgi:hypothetical protein
MSNLPLPVTGIYAARVLQAAPGKSKNSGADMVVLNLALQPSNYRVRSWIVRTPAMEWLWDTFCKSCGLTETADLPEDPQQFVGRLCFVIVTHDEYKGAPQVKIDRYLGHCDERENSRQLDLITR